MALKKTGMTSVLKKLLRDNEFVNFILRNVIKGLNPSMKLTSLYRIYGEVNLKVCDVDFKIYSEADDHIANEIFYHRGYEHSEFQLLKKLLERGKHFIDIGANTGIFSIWAAKANPKLKVISFEPHPSNHKRLKTNISLNRLTNMEPVQKALGEKSGEIEFTIPADFSISATSSANQKFTENFYGKSYTNVLVSQTTIDEALSELPLGPKDIIKIDVEYYELEVLKGAQSTLLNKRPLIMIEILQFENLISQFPTMQPGINKNHAKDVFDFLTKLNYHCYSIEKDGLKFADSMENQNNRNFLFAPEKMPLAYYPFDKISSGLPN